MRAAQRVEPMASARRIDTRVFPNAAGRGIKTLREGPQLPEKVAKSRSDAGPDDARIAKRSKGRRHA